MTGVYSQQVGEHLEDCDRDVVIREEMSSVQQ